MTNKLVDPQRGPHYGINLPLNFVTTRPTVNCGICYINHTSYGQYGYCNEHYDRSLIKVCPNTGDIYYDHPEGSIMYGIIQRLNHGCDNYGCQKPHN